MKKLKKNKTENAKALTKELEEIIEHSKSENEALRKILQGIEKNKGAAGFRTGRVIGLVGLIVGSDLQCRHCVSFIGF